MAKDPIDRLEEKIETEEKRLAENEQFEQHRSEIRLEAFREARNAVMADEVDE